MITLIEVLSKKTSDEKFFDIMLDNQKIGILFTVLEHIAYEIQPSFRGNGYATEALKLATREIAQEYGKSILEIHINNLASTKVAIKSGYVLVGRDGDYNMYHHQK